MDDFYTLLIKDKAIHLAYYFMINGLLDYDKLNTEYYLREIKNGYDTTIKNLNSEKLKKNSKDISIFAQQITKQNELLNIYKSNYGTEGHILDFFLSFTDDKDEYYEQLNIYLEYFKTNSEITGNEKYTFEHYLFKIGSDLAIYFYIYDYSSYDEIYLDSLYNLFKQYLIYTYNYFKKFFSKFISKILEQDFDDKYKDKNKYELLQQYLNLYLYSKKNIDTTIKDLLYFNTVKLNFDIPHSIYSHKKDFTFRNKLLNALNISYQSQSQSQSKSQSKSSNSISDFDHYYNLYNDYSLEELDNLRPSQDINDKYAYILFKALKEIERNRNIHLKTILDTFYHFLNKNKSKIETKYSTELDKNLKHIFETLNSLKANKITTRKSPEKAEVKKSPKTSDLSINDNIKKIYDELSVNSFNFLHQQLATEKNKDKLFILYLLLANKIYEKYPNFEPLTSLTDIHIDDININQNDFINLLNKIYNYLKENQDKYDQNIKTEFNLSKLIKYLLDLFIFLNDYLFKIYYPEYKDKSYKELLYFYKQANNNQNLLFVLSFLILEKILKKLQEINSDLIRNTSKNINDFKYISISDDASDQYKLKDLLEFAESIYNYLIKNNDNYDESMKNYYQTTDNILALNRLINTLKEQLKEISKDSAKKQKLENGKHKVRFNESKRERERKTKIQYNASKQRHSENRKIYKRKLKRHSEESLKEQLDKPSDKPLDKQADENEKVIHEIDKKLDEINIEKQIEEIENIVYDLDYKIKKNKVFKELKKKANIKKIEKYDSRDIDKLLSDSQDFSSSTQSDKIKDRKTQMLKIFKLLKRVYKEIKEIQETDKQISFNEIIKIINMIKEFMKDLSDKEVNYIEKNLKILNFILKIDNLINLFTYNSHDDYVNYLIIIDNLYDILNKKKLLFSLKFKNIDKKLIDDTHSIELLKMYLLKNEEYYDLKLAIANIDNNLNDLLEKIYNYLTNIIKLNKEIDNKEIQKILNEHIFKIFIKLFIKYKTELEKIDNIELFKKFLNLINEYLNIKKPFTINTSIGILKKIEKNIKQKKNLEKIKELKLLKDINKYLEDFEDYSSQSSENKTDKNYQIIKLFKLLKNLYKTENIDLVKQILDIIEILMKKLQHFEYNYLLKIFDFLKKYINDINKNKYDKLLDILNTYIRINDIKYFDIDNIINKIQINTNIHLLIIIFKENEQYFLLMTKIANYFNDLNELIKIIFEYLVGLINRINQEFKDKKYNDIIILIKKHIETIFNMNKYNNISSDLKSNKTLIENYLRQ